MKQLIELIENDPFKIGESFQKDEIYRIREICDQLSVNEFNDYIDSTSLDLEEEKKLFFFAKNLVKSYMFCSSAEIILKNIPPFSDSSVMTLPAFYMNSELVTKITYIFKTITHILNDRDNLNTHQNGKYLSDSILLGRLGELHYRNNISKVLENNSPEEMMKQLIEGMKNNNGNPLSFLLNPEQHYDKIIDQLIDDYISDFCTSRRFGSFPMRLGLSHQPAKLAMHSAAGKRDFAYNDKIVLGNQLQGIVQDLAKPLLVCVLDQWEEKKPQLELQEKSILSESKGYQVENYKGISVYAFSKNFEEEVLRDHLFYKSKSTKARDEHWQALTHILSRLALNPNTHDLTVDCQLLPEVLLKRDNAKAYFDQLFGEHGFFQKIGAFMESEKATQKIRSQNKENRSSQKFLVRMPIDILFVYTSHLYKVPKKF